MAAAANPNNMEYDLISHNNALPALGLTIDKLIPKLQRLLPTIDPFNLERALYGIVSNKSRTKYDINFLVPYSELSNASKESTSKHDTLIASFSSLPSTTVYYFINVYLSIFNGNVLDSPFHQLLANIQVPELIDEQKYTAYNQVSPVNTYNEIFGNDLLVNHLRCFFGIQPCIPEFENARQRDLFFGFIKCGPISRGFKSFIAKITKMFCNVGGHMNSFIIDKTKRLIIHFEPKGSGASVYQPFNLKQFICRVAGEEYIPESSTISINDVEYTFIDTKDLIMVQTKLLNFDIFCQTYSVLAILIYLLNIERIRALPGKSEIMEIFQSITKEDALKFRNFFYSKCSNNFFQILERQRLGIFRDFRQRAVENNNGFENLGASARAPIDYFGNEENEMVGGHRSKKQKYKSRKQTKKTHRKRTHKTRKY